MMRQRSSWSSDAGPSLWLVRERFMWVPLMCVLLMWVLLMWEPLQRRSRGSGPVRGKHPSPLKRLPQEPVPQ